MDGMAWMAMLWMTRRPASLSFASPMTDINGSPHPTPSILDHYFNDSTGQTESQPGSSAPLIISVEGLTLSNHITNASLPKLVDKRNIAFYQFMYVPVHEPTMLSYC